MKDSIFTDAQVAEVAARHRARKAKAVWGDHDVRSAMEDMENVLAELKRTNAMVEIQEQWIHERDQTIKLLQSP